MRENAKDVYLMFCSMMARSIYLRTKTQTRRIVKPQPDRGVTIHGPEFYEPAITDKYGMINAGEPILGIHDDYDWGVKCPYGQPGDRLIVKETWCATRPSGFPTSKPVEGDKIWYKANNDLPTWADYGWRSSMFMPRIAARSIREITQIRAERVQDISEEDAIAEGIQAPITGQSENGEPAEAIYQYINLWNYLNSDPKPVYENKKIIYYESFPWEEIDEVREYRGKPWFVTGNPLVWAISFKETL